MAQALYPHDDSEIGSAFVDVDNAYDLYIDGHLIGSGSSWDSTDAFNFQASCDTPTVYAIHGVDFEQTAGEAAAGMIAEFNHCGEVIRTNTRWKCIASDLPNGSPLPPDFMYPTFDDSAWQPATNFGRNGAHTDLRTGDTDTTGMAYFDIRKSADEIGPDAQVRHPFHTPIACQLACMPCNLYRCLIRCWFSSGFGQATVLKTHSILVPPTMMLSAGMFPTTT